MNEQGNNTGVIVACCRADGRWLLVRRAEGLRRAPGLVGFPGGQVEAGETQEQTLVREMQEELAAEVRPIRPFWEADDQVPGFTLYGWLAELVTPIEQLRANADEVAEILWLTSDEAIDHPQAFSGNASYVQALIQTVAAG